MRYSHMRGLTLIELTAVVAIIGVLAALSFGPIRAAQQRSRDVQRKADLNLIAQAIDLYTVAHRAVPDASSAGATPCSTLFSSLQAANGTAWIPGLDEFVTSTKNKTFPVPVDPLHPRPGYSYTYQCADPVTTPGKSYILTAVLENKHDPDSQEITRGGTTQIIYKLIR